MQFSQNTQLKTIDCLAFADCQSLASVTLPESLVTIGKWSFNKSAIAELRVPKAVHKIDEWAFYQCSNLQVITFA